MATTSWLVKRLRADYPDVSFVLADDFAWSPVRRSVSYSDDDDPVALLTLLHEVAHAHLAHTDFYRDIDLLRFERAAWDHAAHVLAPRYDVPVDGEIVEDMLDTYRGWLHARSRCPECVGTGLQTARDRYHCLGCVRQWRVNDARRCALRRYSLSASD